MPQTDGRTCHRQGANDDHRAFQISAQFKKCLSILQTFTFVLSSKNGYFSAAAALRVNNLLQTIWFLAYFFLSSLLPSELCCGVHLCGISSFVTLEMTWEDDMRAKNKSQDTRNPQQINKRQPNSRRAVSYAVTMTLFLGIRCSSHNRIFTSQNTLQRTIAFSAHIRRPKHFLCKNRTDGIILWVENSRSEGYYWHRMNIITRVNLNKYNKKISILVELPWA